MAKASWKARPGDLAAGPETHNVAQSPPPQVTSAEQRMLEDTLRNILHRMTHVEADVTMLQQHIVYALVTEVQALRQMTHRLQDEVHALRQETFPHRSDL